MRAILALLFLLGGLNAAQPSARRRSTGAASIRRQPSIGSRSARPPD